MRMTTASPRGGHGREPAQPAEPEAFYAESLRLLTEAKIPFLQSGAYAARACTGIQRPTKDLDVFCKPGDYPRILGFFRAHGYAAEIIV
jgi:hypothetical protein